MTSPTKPHTRKRVTSWILTVACAVAGFTALASTPAYATQVRGSTPWSVLLCKFSDKPSEPQNPTFFAQFLTDAGLGLGGVAAYF